MEVNTFLKLLQRNFKKKEQGTYETGCLLWRLKGHERQTEECNECLMSATYLQQ